MRKAGERKLTDVLNVDLASDQAYWTGAGFIILWLGERIMQGRV